MRFRILMAMAAAATLTTACGAPRQLYHHRSPLLYQEMKPFVPEGNIRHIPTDGAASGGNSVSAVSAREADASEDADGEEGGEASDAESDGEDAGLSGLVSPPSGADGAAIASAAAAKVGAKSVNDAGQRFNEDCSGFVRAIYSSAGVDLFADGTRPDDNGVTAIYRFVSRRGGLHEDDPSPGDLVFYRNTADTNRDGRENDGLTHIAIVETVQNDGTVKVIHRNSKGIVRQNMTLSAPDVYKDGDRVLNDYIRGQPSPRVLGELFVKYGRVLKASGQSPLTQAVEQASKDAR